MAKATYQNIRKLCSSVFSRKQTLKFAPATMASCDASIQLLFSGDSTSLRAQTVETQSVYSLQLMSVGKMNADYFKSLNHEVQKKEKKTSTIHRKDLVSQSDYLTAIYSLSGGMYSGTTDNNFTWNILVNKLASIGRVPFDCASSSGDCFFASMGHSLYSNADLHVQIRSAGITHMINHLELYIESVAYESREHYIQEMSKQGTWCDNIIIQAVANALSCTIQINDSDLNAINPTIITPLNSHQKQRIIFLDSQNQNAVKIVGSIKRKESMSVNKRNQELAKKRKLEKQRLVTQKSFDLKNRQSLISNVGQMKLVMQENFGLKKRQSVISNVGTVKLMMLGSFV
ncbi:hypothetical protein pdam_00023329 [Pocillopora damicornis]|uniref:OTU domain-containing protein n=1 Tax=Pocillopora damicornis TaxID=46731 RepID=A0A3M6UTB7_POCDA|nr:hypothetical protein pdam_00023329 [Pocillopora damicornis]